MMRGPLRPLIAVETSMRPQSPSRPIVEKTRADSLSKRGNLTSRPYRTPGSKRNSLGG